MTLPRRLPDPSFAADPERLDVITARARHRRLTRAGGVAGVVAASVVAVAALGGSGGAAGLSVVDPATPPSAGSATPTPPGSAALPSPAPTAVHGSPAVPSQTPAAPRAVATPARDVRTTRTRTETITRETVPYRVDEPCSDTQTTVYNGRPGDSMNFCLRYSWPATMTYGHGTTFVVDYCALGRDHTATWEDRPSLLVRHGVHEWRPGMPVERTETLRNGTCWRWTIRWTGLSLYYADDRVRRLPRGTYDVEVWGPSAGEQSITKSNWAPNRQSTLEIN